MEEKLIAPTEHNRVVHLHYIHKLESASRWKEAGVAWLECPKNGELDKEYDKGQSEACFLLHRSNKYADSYRAEVAPLIKRVGEITNELKEGTNSFDKVGKLAMEGTKIAEEIRDIYRRFYVNPDPKMAEYVWTGKYL